MPHRFLALLAVLASLLVTVAGHVELMRRQRHGQVHPRP